MTKLTLKDKLTSEAQYFEAVEGRPCSLPSNLHNLHTPVSDTWWLKREYLRIAAGIYQESEITKMINQRFTGQHCVHISIEDENLIAFTPSVEQGGQDRQVKMSLGKYLRKHFMLWDDTRIQHLEAEHRAELKGTFEIAYTPEAIKRVYTTMDGDTGCMRFPPSYWNMDVHPSIVYASVGGTASEGLGVAYYEIEGDIKARAVIYTNGEEKRYVRLYGDQLLGKLLKKAGYAPDTLTGLRLNTVKHGEKYVMPYLDGMEGRQQDPRGAFVALIEGQIQVLTGDRIAQVNKLGSNCAVKAKLTCGYIDLPPVPSPLYISAKSGLEFNQITHPKTLYWDGEVKTCSEGEIVNMSRVRAVKDGEGVAVYISDDTPTFDHRNNRWVDYPEARETLGYRRLSTTFYQEGDWYCGGRLTHAGKYIKTEDLVMVYPQEGAKIIKHKDEIPVREKDWAACYDLNFKARIHKSRATAKQTDTGKWFDTESEHPYVKLAFDDVWMLERNTTQVCRQGHTFRVRKGATSTQLYDSIPLEEKRQMIASVFDFIDLQSKVANLVWVKSADKLEEVKATFYSCLGRARINGIVEGLVGGIPCFGDADGRPYLYGNPSLTVYRERFPTWTPGEDGFDRICYEAARLVMDVFLGVEEEFKLGCLVVEARLAAGEAVVAESAEEFVEVNHV